MKLLFTANTAFKLVNFRSGMLRALREDGHDLVALVPEDSHAPMLRKMGIRVLPLSMDNKGTSALRDGALLARFFKAFRAERPDVVLGFTIKNNIYGALAARRLGIPFLPNVTGLGTAFIHDGLVNRVVKVLYRRAFRHLPVVFFQNPDDRALFEHEELTRPAQARLLPGSGIDLQAFRPEPFPDIAEGMRFLLIARLLRDKGVMEFVQACRQLRATGVQLQGQLLGPLGAANRTAVPQQVVDSWVAEGAIEYLGATSDVRFHIAKAHCVVLPSYREGTPRSLLEAAAMGRPVITTDVPGCRETLLPGKSGLVCHVRDAGDLARAMRQMASLTADQREGMGRAGRMHVEARFDERLVIEAYRQALGEIARNRRASAA